MKITIYPACFFKEGNQYSVIFPDLEGLATYGNSVEDAMNMAIDCLAGYIFDAKLDNSRLSKPSDINKINIQDVYHSIYNDSQIPNGSFLSLVSVDVNAYSKKHFEKPVKKTVTIPEWLNEKAINVGINFSDTLKKALIAQLYPDLNKRK
jgi:antitoxin HicB